MSMEIKFIKNPKGVFNVDAEPGEVRWVPRALANQLINRGFAQSVAALERGGYETAEVAPEEKGVLDAAPPRKRKGRRAARNEKAEKPASESSGDAVPPAEPVPEEPGLGGVAEEPEEKEEQEGNLQQEKRHFSSMDGNS